MTSNERDVEKSKWYGISIVPFTDPRQDRKPITLCLSKNHLPLGWGTMLQKYKEPANAFT
jgi:hypothetical protein